MSRIHSPWILTLLFVSAAGSVSAQEDSGGPISRLVGRFRQHDHQHVHAQPAPVAYQYVYEQPAPAEASVAEEPVAEQASGTAIAEATDDGGQASEQPSEAVAYQSMGCDPYGFMGVLNRIRASAGLHPLAYDANLSSWAAQNNAEQCRRGLGHHINPAGIQNCAYNYTDADSTAMGWMNSPGHRRNMLDPSATHFGIAFGPGPYWTLNAR